MKKKDGIKVPTHFYLRCHVIISYNVPWVDARMRVYAWSSAYTAHSSPHIYIHRWLFAVQFRATIMCHSAQLYESHLDPLSSQKRGESRS